MNHKLLITITLLISICALTAQPDRWQQRAEYKMDIDVDVTKHQYNGKQSITYYNNSPDTLDKVFYHLYFNAFQPGSMMDTRSISIDADPRVGSRISKLSPKEIGFIKVSSLNQDGKTTNFETVGTILEVDLAAPILPNSSTVLEMTYDAQVPIQIRRSGRDNREGIDYSMAQWYPKLCEYDYQGWHSHPYVGREFYGVWGDFDVTISIDRNYVVAASGYIQNPEQVGYGYEEKGMTVKRPDGEKLKWHFIAPDVHDFVWAADRDYKHTKYPAADGTMLHFFYQENDRTKDNWAALPAIMDEALQFMNKNYGQYPYKRYSFIQAGDGGMEYPMATLITGNRRLGSLVGVSVHELLHSWYQMVLGSNETLYPWMDEGFTTFASSETMNHLRKKKMIPGKVADNPHQNDFMGYAFFAKSGMEEPLSTHSDHFVSNRAYGAGSYTKGSIFLKQLEYVIGEEAFRKGLLRYFNTWKFKHPNPNDFIRVMEKESGLELDWYKEYMVNTTHTIDYGIEKVEADGGSTAIQLSKIGLMPMPLDVLVTLKDGKKTVYNIPLRIMRGEKKMELEDINFEVVEDWPWTHSDYTLTIPVAVGDIAEVEINPFKNMLDVESDNNKYLAD